MEPQASEEPDRLNLHGSLVVNSRQWEQSVQVINQELNATVQSSRRNETLPAGELVEVTFDEDYEERMQRCDSLPVKAIVI